MKMPGLFASSKPPASGRARRRGLWAPYIAVALAFAAWSLFWLVLQSQLIDRLDREAANLRNAGYEVSWARRTVGGYPFRFAVEFEDLRLAEPSGWGLAAPALRGAAAAYEPDHWVLVLPSGAVLSRPAAGQVDVEAGVLRASLNRMRTEPRFSFEGRDMTFTPRRGADPFPFAAAKLAEFHLRPADGDRTEVFWRMEGVETGRSGVFAQIAPLAPLAFRLSGMLSHRSAFRGRDWRDAVRAWTDRGGEARIQEMTASVGEVSLGAQGGPLTVGYDGRLRGDLALTLRQGAAAIAALGAAQAIDPAQAAAAAAVATVREQGGVQLNMTFQAGVTTLGPVRIGPAPRVY